MYIHPYFKCTLMFSQVRSIHAKLVCPSNHARGAGSCPSIYVAFLSQEHKLSFLHVLLYSNLFVKQELLCDLMYCDVSTQAVFQAFTRDVTMLNIALIINQVCKAFLPHSLSRLLTLAVSCAFSQKRKCLKYMNPFLDSMFVSHFFFLPKNKPLVLQLHGQQKPLLEENVEFHMKKIVVAL